MDKKTVRLTDEQIDLVNQIGGTKEFSKNLRITIEKANKNMTYINDDEMIYKTIEKTVTKCMAKKFNIIAKALYKITYLAFMINSLLITLIIENNSKKEIFELYKKLKSIAHKEIRKEATDISSIENLLKE